MDIFSIGMAVFIIGGLIFMISITNRNKVCDCGQPFTQRCQCPPSQVLKQFLAAIGRKEFRRYELTDWLRAKYDRNCYYMTEEILRLNNVQRLKSGVFVVS